MPSSLERDTSKGGYLYKMIWQNQESDNGPPGETSGMVGQVTMRIRWKDGNDSLVFLGDSWTDMDRDGSSDLDKKNKKKRVSVASLLDYTDKMANFF